jgi:hypothetical protein
MVYLYWHADDILVSRKATKMHGVALAVAVMTAVLSGITDSRSAEGSGEETVLATSSPDEGTIRVGAEPRHIRLSDDVLENAGRWISSGRGRVYLVLDDVQAKQQPGVLYEVFLGATADSSQTLDAAQLIGHLNFFELHKKLLSFDVTAQLGRLAAHGPRDRRLVVTIRPAFGSQLSRSSEYRRELEEADVTIGRVRLVAQ